MAGVTADEARAPGPLALRPRILRTLLWLRWRMLVRRLAGSPGAIVGLVILVVLLVPLAGSIALGTVVAYQNLPLDLAGNVLFYVLGGVYLIWAILPLLQFYTNEGLDVTKLVQYPLTRPEMMAGLILSTLLDVPTLLILAPLIGIGLGWAKTPAAGLAIAVILVLAYIHIVGLSQLLLSSLLGLLRSRRWRDLSLVLMTLLGLSCSLGSQVVFRSGSNTNATASFFVTVLHYDIGSWLQYVPPGMAGRAVQSVAAGDWAAAGLWTGALILSGGLVLWAWQAILTRGLSTAEQLGSGRAPRRQIIAVEAPAAAAARPLDSLTALVPAPVLAIAAKDLIYYWRDPRFKQVLLRSLYFVGILLLPALTNSSSSYGFTRQFVLLAAVFLVQGLTTNAFGYEGEALGTLALFPVRGAYLFVGKNLAAFAVGATEMAVLVGVQAVFAHNWAAAPASLVAVVAGMLVALGAGNVIAMLFPVRTARPGLGRANLDSGTGCLTSLYSAGAYLTAELLLIPVILALYLPGWLGVPAAQIVALPLAALYALGIYVAGTAIAARNYYPRLPEIIKVVTKT